MPAIHDDDRDDVEGFEPEVHGSSSPPAHALEHLLDMGDRRVGQDAMAEIEDERPAAKAFSTSSTSRSSAAPPARKISGSTLPCTGTRLWICSRAKPRSIPLSEADRSRRRSPRHSAEYSCRRRAESRSLWRPGIFARSLAIKRLVGCTHQRSKSSRRQQARPGIENLHHIGAGFQLPRKIIDRSIDQAIDKMLKGLAARARPSSSPAPDRACLGRRPYKSPPSTARRKIRSMSFHGLSSPFTRRTVS